MTKPTFTYFQGHHNRSIVAYIIIKCRGLLKLPIVDEVGRSIESIDQPKNKEIMSVKTCQKHQLLRRRKAYSTLKSPQSALDELYLFDCWTWRNTRDSCPHLRGLSRHPLPKLLHLSHLQTFSTQIFIFDYNIRIMSSVYLSVGDVSRQWLQIIIRKLMIKDESSSQFNRVTSWIDDQLIALLMT